MRGLQSRSFVFITTLDYIMRVKKSAINGCNVPTYPSPLVQQQEKEVVRHQNITYDRVGGCSLDSLKISPAAQGKMKMTEVNIAYDQPSW